METLKTADGLSFLPPEGHSDGFGNEHHQYLQQYYHGDDVGNPSTIRLDGGLGVVSSIWNLTPEENSPSINSTRMARHSPLENATNSMSDPDISRHLNRGMPGPPQTGYMRAAHAHHRNMPRPTERLRPVAIGRTHEEDAANLAFYKTVPCKYRNCKKGDACPFAHGPSELRTYKTAMCKAWEERGFCVHGDVCTYAHGEHELRVKGELQRAVAPLSLPPSTNNYIVSKHQHQHQGPSYSNPNSPPSAHEAGSSGSAEIEVAFAQVKAMRMGDKLRVRYMMESLLTAHHGHMMSTYSMQVALKERRHELGTDRELSLLHVLVFGLMYPKLFRTNVQTHIISLIPSRRSGDSTTSSNSPSSPQTSLTWTNTATNNNNNSSSSNSTIHNTNTWSNSNTRPSGFHKLTKMELGVLAYLGLLPHLDVLDSHGIDYQTLMRMDEADVSGLHMLPSAVRTQITSVLNLAP